MTQQDEATTSYEVLKIYLTKKVRKIRTEKTKALLASSEPGLIFYKSTVFLMTLSLPYKFILYSLLLKSKMIYGFINRTIGK